MYAKIRLSVKETKTALVIKSAIKVNAKIHRLVRLVRLVPQEDLQEDPQVMADVHRIRIALEIKSVKTVNV